MEILDPDEFFARFGEPETWKPLEKPRPDPMAGRCGGIVTEDTTREDLLARGFTEEAADEALQFCEYLKARSEGERREYKEWSITAQEER